MKKLIFLIFLISSNFLFAKSLTLWHSYRGKERLALEKITKEFSEKNKINVKTLAIPYDAFAKKLTNSIPRNSGPDVFIFANDKIGSWVESKLIESLDFYFSRKNKSFLKEFFKNTINALVYKNSIYALPVSFKVPVLFYNKKLISSCPTNFDELITVSKEKMASNKKLLGLAYENTNFFFHSFLYYGFNGRLFDENIKVLMNSKDAFQSFEYAKKLSTSGIMPQEINSAVITTLFNSNKLLFVINGPWFSGEISKINYGICPIPMIGDRKPKPYISIEGIFMNSFSKKKNDSLKLMKYITKEGAYIRLNEAKQTVSFKKAYDNASDELKVYNQQALSCTPISNQPEMSYFWAPMSQALKRVIEQNVSIKKALNDSEEKLKKLLKK